MHRSRTLQRWVSFQEGAKADFGDALFVVHHRRYTCDESGP